MWNPAGRGCVGYVMHSPATEPDSAARYPAACYPADRFGLIHRNAVLAAGYTDNDLRASLRRREIERVHRGVFVVRAERTRLERHRLVALASVRAVRGDGVGAGDLGPGESGAVESGAGKPEVEESGAAVSGVEESGPKARAALSHQSAAAVHGLEMLSPTLTRVHSTTVSGAGFRTATHHRHVAALSDDELVEVDGVLITSIERTAVDIACGAQTFAQALAVVDSALRLGADRDVMTKMLAGKRRGVGLARRALHHADGRSENPGESWSRAQMIEAGLPAPRLQHTFRDVDGEHVARTDFDWGGRLVGEFDGKVKYAKLLKPGEDATEVVVREKRREDELRAMGIMVVRWTWDDLRAGRVTALIRRWLVTLALIVEPASA